MKTQKYPNLTPWQPGQSGNPSGRKPGSKNISTLVREMLEQEANTDVLTKNNLTELIQDSPPTYAKAIVQVTIQKALRGDMRAIVWLAEQQERNAVQRDVERREPIIVSHIKPRFPA